MEQRWKNRPGELPDALPRLQPEKRRAVRIRTEEINMSDFSDKRQQALVACEKVINGIEDESISVLSALLQCKKIARLVNDLDGQEWLGYELDGYPEDGKGFITHEAFKKAREHGRVSRGKNDTGKCVESMFTELCAELETSIKSRQAALNNYTTQGVSVGGDHADTAMSRLTYSVSTNTNNLLANISKKENKLSILRSQYYNYALKWQIELTFGRLTKTIFDSYQEKIDQYCSLLPKTILSKLSAIENMMQDGNPENYAHVLTSCRRLWSEIADHLFSEAFPNYSSDTYKTLSGKTIIVSEEHDNNRLSATIEKLQSKAARNTLVGSEIVYLADWLKQINDIQNAGVHKDVTKEEAERCIIHTYIALGDILSLKAEAEKKSSSEEKQQP